MFRPRIVRRRPILATAAVGGVAYSAGHHAAARQAQQAQIDAQQNAQIADLQQQSAPPQPVYQQPAPPPVYQEAPPPPAAPSGADQTEALEQLKKLGALRDSKVLTEAEFEEAKRKILNEL